jgi:quercetin dioxygenase-like cupin family protein
MNARTMFVIPPGWKYHYEADGIFVLQLPIIKAGTEVPQHAHAHEHMSMLARGAVQVWKDGVFMGDFHAPDGIVIAAHCKHKFLSLEDNTLIYCIHNVSRTGEIEVAAEHQLEGD